MERIKPLSLGKPEHKLDILTRYQSLFNFDRDEIAVEDTGGFQCRMDQLRPSE